MLGIAPPENRQFNTAQRRNPQTSGEQVAQEHGVETTGI